MSFHWLHYICAILTLTPQINVPVFCLIYSKQTTARQSIVSRPQVVVWPGHTCALTGCHNTDKSVKNYVKLMRCFYEYKIWNLGGLVQDWYVITLQWRHNETDGVSIHQPQRKHQSSASLAFVNGIHQWPVNSPFKGPVVRRMVPLDDVILIYGCAILRPGSI